MTAVHFLERSDNVRKTDRNKNVKTEPKGWAKDCKILWDASGSNGPEK